MIDRLTRRPRGVLLAVALVTAFAWLGSRGLFETTEGRYAECAREMVETGNWLVPQLDYQPHWTKPPLAYWAIAGAIAAGGRNAWAVRSVGALAFLITVVLVGSTARVLFGPRVGFIAALVYATSPFAVAGGSVVSTDMLLAMWSMAVVWAYWRAREARRDRAGRWTLAMWAFAGMGFVTKGPPALLALASVLVFHALDTHRGADVPSLRAGRGLAIFAVVGLWWYAVVVVRQSGLLTYFLGDEVVGRVFTPKFHRNPQWYGPLTMYAGPLLAGTGLWLFLLPVSWWRGREAAAAPGGHPDETPNRDLRGGVRFALVWLIVSVVVLSISRSRLTLYVLPVFSAVVLLVARSLEPLACTQNGRRAIALIAVVSVGLVASARFVAARKSGSRDMLPLYKACVEAGGANPAVYIASRDHLYGLVFYLNGRAVRVSAGKEGGDTRLSTRNDPPRAIAAAPRAGAAIVADRGRRQDLDTLVARGWAVTRVLETRRYVVARVVPPANIRHRTK